MQDVYRVVHKEESLSSGYNQLETNQDAGMVIGEYSKYLSVRLIKNFIGLKIMNRIMNAINFFL